MDTNLLHSRRQDGIEKNARMGFQATSQEFTNFRNRKIGRSLSTPKSRLAPQFTMLLVLLFTAGKAYTQGYLNMHLKALNETSSTNVVYNISGPNGYSNTITLNDRPTQESLEDIGSSQSGRMYAVTKDNGTLYYRDVSTASWVKTTITGISRVDGGSGDEAWLVTTSGNVLKYSGSGNSTTTYYTYISGTNWKATDVAFALNITTDNGVFVLRADGKIWRYFVSISAWQEHSLGTISGTVKNIDAAPGGTVFAATDSRVYSSYTSGTSTDFGNPANDIRDIAVASVSDVYVSASGAWKVKKFNSGTTWDAFEAESYGTERMTGGLSKQLWGVNMRSFSTLGNINSRAYNGQTGEILWVDDERVRDRSVNVDYFGNTRFMPLSAGVYTITQNVVSGWELQKISIYNPTSINNTSNYSTRTVTVDIVDGQSTNIIWQLGNVNAFNMTNSCDSMYLETFSTGNGSYLQAPNGQTSYHYYDVASSAPDGTYALVTNGTDFAGWASGLTEDHTIDAGGALGYMYAVNAGFDKGEFFRRRFTGLIIGAKYKFSTWVSSLSNASIQPNISLKVYNAADKNLIISNNSGLIYPAFQWKEYKLEFIATSTSIDLVLDNNNVGGDGNDLALDDISFKLMPPDDITTSSISATCGVNAGSITVTAPLGSAIEYSLNGGSYQAGTTFNNVVPGASHTVRARFVGTTGCVTTATAAVPVSICGNVFNDVNGLSNGKVDGILTNTAAGTQANLTQLYVNLFHANGAWKDSVSVQPDGSYSFSNISVSTAYSVAVSNFRGSPGQILALPNANRLPLNYVNTGENIGVGVGNDGTVNGKQSVPVLLTSLNDVNFGIQRIPTAGSGTYTGVNALGNTSITVPANTFTNSSNSTDYDGGSVTSIVITAIPSGASSITINGITYTSSNFPALGVTVPINLSGQPTQTITVDPTANGNTVVSIPFVAVDEAGFKSVNTGTQGTAVLNLSAAPVTVSGNVFNDASGNAIKDGSEPNTNAGGLYANLVNPTTGAVIQSVPVNATTGAYDFTNVPANVNYNLILTKDDKTGATSLTTSDLPATWVNTGVNINGSPNTSNKTGVLPLIVETAPITNVNFGIEQGPTAGSGTNVIPNVVGTGQVAVPLNTFTNSANSTDAIPGNITSIVITGMPSGVTSIHVNGTTYGPGFTPFPAAGITINTDANGLPVVGTVLTIDPSATGISTITIPFVAVDNAGVKSTNTGTQGMAVLQTTEPLPLSLMSFTASKGNDRNVDLYWKTAAEVNTDKFEVETSLEGKLWKKIGTLLAKGEGIDDEVVYNYIDNNPVVGLNFYRLKIIDKDGIFTYSNIAKVLFEKGAVLSNIYPNPTTGQLYIGNVSVTDIASVEIVDFTGKVVFNQKRVTTNGLNVSSLISGTFNVNIHFKDGHSETHKIVINR